MEKSRRMKLFWRITLLIMILIILFSAIWFTVSEYVSTTSSIISKHDYEGLAEGIIVGLAMIVTFALLIKLIIIFAPELRDKIWNWLIAKPTS